MTQLKNVNNSTSDVILRSALAQSYSSDAMDNFLSLTREDKADLITKRGLRLDWAIANVARISKQKAESLGFSAESDGLILFSTQGMQFKPDTPKLNKNGKSRKYVTPSGTGKDARWDAFLPIHPELGVSYWSDIEALKERCVRIDGKPYLIITEGGFKAIAGCSNGFPTIALPGVSMFMRQGESGKELLPILQCYASLGFNFIVAYDADAAFNKNVRIAERKLSSELAKIGCSVMSITGKWKPTDGKGMDDYLQNNGKDDFAYLLKMATAASSIENALSEKDASSGKKKSSRERDNEKLISNYHQVTALLGDKLKFNELKKEIEYDGKILNTEGFRLWLALEAGIETSEQDAFNLTLKVAMDNSYHPVRNYLDSVATRFSPSSDFLDKLASRYFGTEDKIHAIFLKRFLIASVARIYEPGCKFDNLLILQGKQGFYKSSFFKVLFGQNFFNENLTTNSGKDELLALHEVWCSEYAEFEAVWRKKDTEQLKGFLSTAIDKFREPYGRKIKSFPRMSVVVATANGHELLHDPTGNRRFWIVPVASEIPLDLVEHERDLTWAAAVAAYKKGEKWWLNHIEQEASNRNSEIFQSYDPWFQVIEDDADGKDYINLNDIIERVLGYPVDKQDNKIQSRVKNILRQLGYEPSNNRVRIDGKQVRVWEKRNIVCESAVTSVTGVTQELESSPSNTSSCDSTCDTASTNIDVVTASNSITCDTTQENTAVSQVLSQHENFTQQSIEALVTPVTPKTQTFENTNKKSSAPSLKGKQGKAINIGSIVKHKDKRYPHLYKVVGGSNGKWQLERVDVPAKSDADFLNATTSQLELVE